MTMQSKNVEISVLVPVYKVESYLQRCIDSVLSQDFTDYELILVDDGSPDKCPEICDINAKRYPDKIKVVHKENLGLVSARLAGWERARGEYIVFLDSDDFLLPKALTNLYNKIVEGYDIVKGNNRIFTDKGELGIDKPRIPAKEICGSENYLSALLNYDILPYLWGGIYRKSLFSIKIFNDLLDISICEDWMTNQAIHVNVKKYAMIDSEVYAYFINTKSMMQCRVMSHQYHEKLHNLMLKYSEDTSDEIQYLIETDRIAAHIRCFFMPELEWNNYFYKKIIQFLNIEGNEIFLKNKIDNKFLIFMRYKLLFRLYTIVYNFVFKYLRLKGGKRNVV